MIKKDEEPDEEERKSCLDLYIEDCKLLMKSIQVITESIEMGKVEMGKGEQRREKETKELWDAVNRNDVKKVKTLLKRGIADIDWKNPRFVSIITITAEWILKVVFYLITNQFVLFLFIFKIEWHCTKGCMFVWPFRDLQSFDR